MQTPSDDGINAILGVPTTPAFVFDEAAVRRALVVWDDVRGRCGVRVLYSVKALPFAPVLRWLAPVVDGFAVSSPFEAGLVHDVAPGVPLHLTSPGLRLEDAALLRDLRVTVAFNSLSQLRRIRPLLPGGASWGVRVNPEFSFLDDVRYDPCRPHSKLGVPVAEVEGAMGAAGLGAPGEAFGLHVHNAFETSDLSLLGSVMERMRPLIDAVGPRLSWLNLGGGYLLDGRESVTQLARLVQMLPRVPVYSEPGKALVGAAGYLVASVVDCFQRQEKQVAVLDASVNHHPAVFEYQMRPPLGNEVPDGPHSAVLAGGTCLAGDVFGEYSFARPLRYGDRVVFSRVGAYALPRAHRFNGHNLPDLYTRGLDGQIVLQHGFTYDEYRASWSSASASLSREMDAKSRNHNKALALGVENRENPA